MADSSLTDSVERGLQDLFSLEINLIRKPTMTGTRMPPPKEALDQLCQSYAQHLGQPAPAALSGLSVAASNAPLSDAAAAIHRRVAEAAARLAPLHDRLQKDPAAALSREDYLALRKAWELGTEEILLQTVIHLDGDVITRVSDAFAAAPSPLLLQLHQQSVEQSVSFWTGLVQIMRAFLGAARPA